MGKRDWIQGIRDCFKSSEMSPVVKPAQEKPLEGRPLETVLTQKSAVRIRQGALTIPGYITEIAPRALERNRELVSVTIPGSVKSIGNRAFAECTNLKQVVLCEGIESIGPNAFTDCERLTSIVIPDSVKEIDGRAFYRCGLTEPVRNASGNALYFCPAATAGAEYVVPAGVRHIGDMAFSDLTELRQVHLPDGLERIGKMAFRGCGLSEITIPASVKEIGDDPFWRCANMRKIVCAGQMDPIRAAIDFFRLRGIPFLMPVHAEIPDDRYWLAEVFQALAQKCAAGNPNAVERMAVFFLRRKEDAPEIAFYRCAANLWNYRSYERGNRAAAARMKTWIEAFPGKPLLSAFLTERLRGTADGRALNALGFLFF